MLALGLRTRAGSSLLSYFHCPAPQIFQSKNNDSIRSVSTSPYGRTHVWKRRPPVLPLPVVPKYAQTVIRSDGSSFVHWITSPKSLVRLTRDTTNNPLWNMANWANDRTLDEEVGSAGRMGRFSRKFGGTTLLKEAVTAKTEEKEKEDVEVKEDMVDLTGEVDMAMGGSMGGVLDDVSWYEQMAEMTGGESKMPGKGKKKKKD